MFSTCSELTPRARIPDTRIPQLMQPWMYEVDEAKMSSVSERFFADVHLHSTWSLADTLSRAIPYVSTYICHGGYTPYTIHGDYEYGEYGDYEADV